MLLNASARQLGNAKGAFTNAYSPKGIFSLGLCAASALGTGALAAPPASGPCSLVAALGDDAFSSVLGANTGNGFATLTVRKGGTAYVFKIYSRLRDIPQQMAIEKALAINVLAML
jgi:hypothetical protein